MKFWLIPIFTCFLFHINAQELPIAKNWKDGFWEARWICHPTAATQDYGVFHFRKRFDIEKIPEQFIIHVSADNRYKLFVNGVQVALGPARGDLEHWRFETVDLSTYLVQGENVVAAAVWNFGLEAPAAQISYRTAFILQGNTALEKVVNTDDTWKVIQNEAYEPELEDLRAINSYLVVGPGDRVDASAYPWGWETIAYQDDSWEAAKTIAMGQTFGRGTDGRWRLVPRQIPMMTVFELKEPLVRRAEGITIPFGFLSKGQSLEVPPNSKIKILLDQEKLVTAYPSFSFHEGKGSKVKITYSEALFDEEGLKGNRNEVEGKSIIGYSDVFLPDGGAENVFQPLWLRTWRYLQIEIETSNAALFLDDMKAYFTGYPFDEKASFESDQTWLDTIWNVGWHTARLCAGETYYDCPYYEQLQYVGDTRIQALISLYVSGDDRLMRRAINDFAESRIWNGLTQSRYPSNKLQVIPTYSLWWISMVYDYWMHHPDEEYVKSLLPTVRTILEWYASQINEQGLVGQTKWWNFVDWAREWPWDPTNRIGGVPAQEINGNSSIIGLQYLYALNHAEALHRLLDAKYFADLYKNQRSELRQNIYNQCWDLDRKLLRDIPKKPIFSQHANILGVLTDAIPKTEQKAVMNRIMSELGIIHATFYFKFYLFQALQKTGLADQYLDQLKPWKQMIDMGLSTFAERPEPTRSDCHAWSASPNYHLLSLVAGIKPSAPGFEAVEIAPSFGELSTIKANMPHPEGVIILNIVREENDLNGVITLPENVKGVLKWKEREKRLKGGENTIKMKYKTPLTKDEDSQGEN